MWTASTTLSSQHSSHRAVSSPTTHCQPARQSLDHSASRLLFGLAQHSCLPLIAVRDTADCTLLAEIRMLLLHDQRLDDNVARAFLFDCYDLYVKVRHTTQRNTMHAHRNGRLRQPQALLSHCRLTAVAGVRCGWVMSVQLLLNPFYDKSSVITSRAFDERVRAIGDKYLNR